MNKTQFLLSKLAEECAEVAKVALKAQQMGLQNQPEGRATTNLEELCLEINDIMAHVVMLNMHSGLGFLGNATKQREKMERVERIYKQHHDPVTQPPLNDCSLLGKFVSARVVTDTPGRVRQGWVITLDPLIIVEQSGALYKCLDTPGVIQNPPNMSADARRTINRRD